MKTVLQVNDGVPAQILTALAKPGDRVRCLEEGASEYLSITVGLKIVASVIEQHLDKTELKATGDTWSA